MHDEIGLDDLEARLAAGARLIDVREPWEYYVGRIPGAVNVPMSQVVERIGDVPDNVVLVCATGARSGEVANYLTRNGYARVANLTPGTAGWREAGFDLESGPPSAGDGADPADTDPA